MFYICSYRKSLQACKQKNLSVGILHRSFVLSVMIMLGFAQAGQATKSGEHLYRYQVFAGGFEVAELETRYQITKNDYTINALMRGVGFVQSLLNIESSYQSYGKINDTNIQPRKFTTDAVWRGKETHSTVFFYSDKDPTFEYSPKDSGFEIEQYPKDVLSGSTDPASVSMLIAQQMRHSGNCALESKIFTAQHRIDLVITDHGVTSLPENEIIGARDDVHHCAVTATKVRSNDKPEDDEPIVFNLYLVTNDTTSPPYPILLEGTYGGINSKVWMVDYEYQS
ncbi:MAG: DUF3108 domain-containing protein [Alphaproteobacteria bacterium]|nr:DUF3108 domain-containing protein [Alphaproteobacteria bacterium]